MVIIDIVNVVIAAVIFLILYSLWYAPLIFGNLRKKLTNRDINRRWYFYIIIFIVAIVISYFLALIEGYLGVSSFWDGVIAGFIIWFGFVFTVQILLMGLTKAKWSIFFIDMGCLLLNFMIAAGIIAG